ncbi:metal ABC transporter permease [Bartonella sp. AR 15-3]|uniref:metal ABC transporter permease n=1 Tax=Bartonella sp. AR 15-3 TaxID=545617 RepID=UPI0001F4BB6D|nr:metal ABC transporter permease [Bartonella sp. AR 15-3]OPB32483.1 manganese/iron transport system permease protein [Bartonella sp. AR 15-3]CBI78609.1 Iron transport protein, inner membrane component [Bartonella sp. AR 15-3]
MIGWLLEPFTYQYMINAMWVSGLIGCVCAFLSAFLMLKGWSLIGDALSHSIVPGVAGAYLLGLPFSFGAFFSGGLAAAAMLFLNYKTKLKEDTIIGLIFSFFFAFGLFLKSLRPMSVNIDTIVLGNILAVSSSDIMQLACIGFVTLFILCMKWKDLLVFLFDESYAHAIGLNVTLLKILFFTLLAACTVAAMQTVGAFLVICLVITPGATAYLLSDRFVNLLIIAVMIGTLTSILGVYMSYFLNAQTGGVVVLFQTFLFIVAFIFAPKYGYIATRLRVRAAKRWGGYD